MKAKAKIIIENNGCILVLKPLKKKKYTLIGGTVNKNESPTEAIIREAREEANIRINSTSTFHFKAMPTIINSKLHMFHCFILQGENIPYKLMETEKFESLSWVPIEQALKNLKGIEKFMIYNMILEGKVTANNNFNNINMA